MHAHAGAEAPKWIDTEPKPELDPPQRAGTAAGSPTPPSQRGQRAPARRAGGTYWLAVALIVAGVLAIVPLYFRESVTRARLDALEKFTDTIGCRTGVFRPRSRVPARTPVQSSREPQRPESASGAFAERPF